MSKRLTWMAWYPADILQDAKYVCLDRSARLTYRELLDRAWLNGAKLPNSEKKLSALAGMPLEDFKQDWEQIQDPGDPCFITHPDTPGFLTNKRLLAEWRVAEDIVQRAQFNGKKGGRPPKHAESEQPDKPTKKTDPVSSGLAKQNPPPNPNESSLPIPRPKPREEKSVGAPPKGDAPVPLEKLMERYPEEGRQLIAQVFDALASTRKAGTIAQSVLRAQLLKWNAYPVPQVIGGIKTYLDKGYHEDGKKEEYLLGVIRNWRKGDGPTQGAKHGKPNPIEELYDDDA